MARSKTHKELEHYIGIIKEQKSEIRKLQKELSYYKKREHISDDIISGALDIIDNSTDKVEICDDCGKGELSFIIIANKGFKKCNLCDFRSNSIKLEKK